VTGDAELVAHKALELLLLIRSGIFDPHLEQILAAVTDRMASPARVRPQQQPTADPDTWPNSGLFAPRDGA
jgi:hypothetical protein